MMVQKRPSAIGSGIGGGLKRPTLLKPPSTNTQQTQNAVSHGITGSKNLQQPSVSTRVAAASSPNKVASPKNERISRLPIISTTSESS